MNKAGVAMNEPTTASCAAAGAGLSVNLTGIGTKCGLWIAGSALLLVFVLAVLVMMAMTPPRTAREMAGMLAVSLAHSVMVGPLVIECMGWTSWSFQAQLCVCFCMAAPGWLLWRIVSHQLARWRDAKNPIQAIAADVGSARQTVRGYQSDSQGRLKPEPPPAPPRKR